jgi:LysM repeat protein
MNNLRSNNIIAGKSLVINRASVKKDVTPANSKTLANANTVTQKQETENPLITQQQTDSITNSPGAGVLANYFRNRNVHSGASPPADSLFVNIADTTMLLVENADENAATSQEYHTDDDRTIYHKVKIGETLLSIAKRYHVSAVEIVAWNKLPAKKAKIGQRLMIKLPEKTGFDESELLAETENTDDKLLASTVSESSNANIPEAAALQKPAKETGVKTNPADVVYRVKRGDSLSVIAKKYHQITAEDIMLANNLKSDKLSVGQKLKIPVN